MKRFLAPKLVLTIALFYTLVLVVVCLMKFQPGFLPFEKVSGADKVFHSSAYFGLTLVWHFYFFSKKGQTKQKPILMICGLAIIFGIFIEVLQGVITTYRSMDVYDVLANTTGVVVAFIILTLLNPPQKVKSR